MLTAHKHTKVLGNKIDNHSTILHCGDNMCKSRILYLILLPISQCHKFLIFNEMT